MGTDCKEDADCFGSTMAGTRCVNNVCIKPRYNGLGCSNDRHCYSGQCSGGRCSGMALGFMCDPDKVSCNQGLYCSATTSTCTPQLGLGDYCSDYKTTNYHGSNWNVICKGGLKCSGPPQNEYCISYKTGLKGTPCNAQMDGDDSCKFGLTCSRRRRICVDMGEDIISWRCNGSPVNCTYENEEMCICSRPGVGACQKVFELYSPKCNFDAAANKYRDCIAENNCAFEPSTVGGMEINVLDRETCIGKFCGGEVLSAVCCGYQGFVAFRYSPANMPPYCSNSNPALAVFLVLFFLCLGSIALIAIIAVVAALAYYFIKVKPIFGGNSNSSSVYANNTTENFEALE